MSYAHADDDDGRLSELRDKLSAQTQKVIGEEFPIFQDHEDIKWGQDWEARIKESLAEVTFFIPIITPSFFKSKYCRDELARFLEREERLGLKLILPVYYIETPQIKDKFKRSSDELAQEIASRQYADCRDLIIEDLNSQKIRQLIFDLATQIRDALDSLPLENVAPPAAEPKREEIKPETPNPDTLLYEKIEKPIVTEQAPAATEPKRQKTGPPTIGLSKPKISHRDIVVDQMYRGDFATISKAIDASNPGDRILVRPGIYKDRLLILKPLEIVGEGGRDEIVVQVKGNPALYFNATTGRVAHLTLRQEGRSRFWGECYGVDIAQGRLLLEDCDISSQSLSCVAIHDGADPRLRRNKIRDGKEGGVIVYDSGRGSLEENEIFGNAYSGVVISKGGNPTLNRNKIHNNKANGVQILDTGEGTLEKNEIFKNAYNGVSLGSSGNTILRHNRINDNGGYGIQYFGGGGIIEDNDLRDNRKGAWASGWGNFGHGEPKVKRARNLE